MAQSEIMPERSRRLTCVAAGDQGLLIEDPLGAELTQLALEARKLPGVTAVIPGHSSLLVLLESADEVRRADVAARLLAGPVGGSTHSGNIREITVSFEDADAPDFPRLIAASGLPREKLIAAIASLTLRVRFLGFLPGFGYLDGWPGEWQLPRLETPRPAVPAGSFAIAGPSAGFYPSPSPGGWNLIGRSDASFWDPFRTPASLLSPGDEIRVIPGVVGPVASPATFPLPDENDPVAEVLSPGTFSVRTGAPRLSNLELGAFPGGAFDPEAAAVANRAVGNPADAAVLECALSGPRLRMLVPGRLSWSGATAEIAVDGKAVRDSRIIAADEGSVITIGRIGPGARGWLALAGGWGVSAVPALRASPLRAGEILTTPSGPLATGRIRTLERTSPLEIRAVAGPAIVDPRKLEELQRRSWIVTERMDRIGVRLVGGPGSEFSPPASLPSAPLQFGTVQWHPDGSLLVMGPDHPVTGGYLQVMTIPSVERWKIAQLASGSSLRWRIEPAVQYA